MKGVSVAKNQYRKWRQPKIIEGEEKSKAAATKRASKTSKPAAWQT